MPGFAGSYKWKDNVRAHTWRVQLPLFQESFINYKRSIAGQLEEPADQAIGCVVFVGNEFQVVHVRYSHLQMKRLQREIFLMIKELSFPLLRKHIFGVKHYIL